MKWNEATSSWEVKLSEEKMLVTKCEDDYEFDLITTAETMTSGRHYWEVQIEGTYWVFVGIARPGLEQKGKYVTEDCTDGWFIETYYGMLHGNGKSCSNMAGGFNPGDRVGVLLDLDDGSLMFFKNGVKHGPGFPPGSVMGAVVKAMQLKFMVHEDKTTSPQTDYPMSGRLVHAKEPPISQ
jgi:hypothetical protein